MNLPPQAIYCLSEAINKLHEAARLIDSQKTKEELQEIADRVSLIKGERNEVTTSHSFTFIQRISNH